MQPGKYCVFLGEKEIEYSVRKSKKARRMQLRAGKGIEAVVPEKSSIDRKKIEEFIKKNNKWVLKNLEKKEIAEKQAIEKKDFLLFLGKEVPIKIMECGLKNPKAIPGKGMLLVKVPFGKKELAKKAVKKFYLKQAKLIIPKIVEKKAVEMDVSFSRISIRSQKTVWGSCSPKKTLSFSRRIMAAPQNVLEYLVVHELAHLKHRNHSKAFWQTVKKYCPYYKESEKWLRKNSSVIMARTE